MKTQILKINDPEKDIEKLKKAAECVASGGLVVFPTETVYGIACKADKKSLAKLDEVKKRDTDKRYTLHIAGSDKLSDYVSHLSGPEKKLVKNGWPGPLTIVFGVARKDISENAKLLYKDNTIGIRCPSNDIARAFLKLCDFPVVAPSANTAGKEAAANAKDAIQQLDGLVDMILDGGTCKHKKSSTVVKISQAGFSILRAGVYSERQIRKMLTINILFVCTGNTCRSPMAEGLARKAIAEKLGCKVDQLAQMGYKTGSAGSVAINGIGASPESIRFCDSRGVDISGHKSRRITPEMLDEADYIFAMSAGHKNDIMRLCPTAGKKCMLLSDSGDIKDPIGGDFETYKICGGKIEKAVNKRISELLK
ncbi:MAG: threonylcarbamoyl-AMP synthase [Planctomycetes bacterium]|nr:threonylcarbamoyl-AMP synthase [Planctomycetota bacterium]MBU1519047.1 threonylcarbamoyl-AMP synthase [Planctomycetota bacterium]MBU2457480.1 threonylcarbamoyl-AMP synthase [Planctomycetota bacterium]MBU2597038.1 threonylcarbamoyl-AMP synthase [Planctomycetota bacterium]